MKIKESYCSYEVSKLLKEKGFDEEIETLITQEGTIFHLDENSISKEKHQKIKNSKINIYSNDVSCPTQSMAMAWLREEKNIHIIAIPTMYHSKKCNYTPVIHKITNVEYGYDFENGIGDVICNSYEEVIEAALLYTLKNLI